MISVFMCNTQSLEDAWHNELSIKTGFMLETQCLLDGEDYYNALADLSCASEFKIYDTEMYEDCPGFQVKFKQFLAFINDKAGHCTFTCCWGTRSLQPNQATPTHSGHESFLVYNLRLITSYSL